VTVFMKLRRRGICTVPCFQPLFSPQGKLGCLPEKALGWGGLLDWGRQISGLRAKYLPGDFGEPMRLGGHCPQPTLQGYGIGCWWDEEEGCLSLLAQLTTVAQLRCRAFYISALGMLM